ncbi:unnamed protein product [Pleuronectes platessa]|uniref:Uncharacterized protein n=1 Tax=Pleuronectes platessa TaxID=8262 RepID=A0A9N7VJC4_PLEPL|nr:unnamed protein product [Pleuronectes platessa]
MISASVEGGVEEGGTARLFCGQSQFTTVSLGEWSLGAEPEVMRCMSAAQMLKLLSIIGSDSVSPEGRTLLRRCSFCDGEFLCPHRQHRDNQTSESSAAERRSLRSWRRECSSRM